MSSVTAVKCSKPQGEYCRLHNPAPKGFVSAEDALKKASKDFRQQQNQQASLSAFVNKHFSSFQDINEQRCLPEGVPEYIADHIVASNEKLQHLDEFQRKALAGYTSFAAGVCNQVLLNGVTENTFYEDAPLWRETDSAPTDFLTADDLADYMETLDGVLATRQEESRILYRGIPLYSKLHDQIGASIGKELRHGDVKGLVAGLQEFYKPGTVIKNETYLSTSLSAYYAADRTTNMSDTKALESYSQWRVETPAGILFEMKTNAGLDFTGAARHNAYEREVAVPRETYFKVVNVYVQPESYDTISGYDFKDSTEKELETFTNIAAVVQMVEVDKHGREISHTKPHVPERSAHEVVLGKD